MCSVASVVPRYLVDDTAWLMGMTGRGYVIQADPADRWEFDIGTGLPDTSVIGSAITAGWHLL